jgi:hypothetical protein
MNNQNKLPDEDKELWDLLAEVPPAKAGSMFSRNVMREIRLEEAHSKSSLMKRMRAWKPALVGVGMGLCATLLIAVAVKPSSQNGVVNQTPEPDVEKAIPQELKELAEAPATTELITKVSTILEDDDLVGEFLVTITETPEILAEEDIIAMLSF